MSKVGDHAAGNFVDFAELKQMIQNYPQFTQPFSDEEFKAGFDQLQDENICMIVDNEITLIT